MNIRSVHIYGFGKYQDDTFQFGPGINLIEGNNEAGKSTFLSFIKAILFGFESKRAPEDRYEPLKGGNFGGAIELLDSTGEVYRIERVGHRKSQGLVRVFFPNGEIKGEEAIAPLLGGLSPQFYGSIQAFGLSELSYLESLYDDQTEAYLYQAGTGITMRELEKHAAEETDKLFKPKGNLPKINQLLTQLEETDKQIKLLQKENESYQRIVLDKKALDAEIESLQRTMETEQQTLKMWDKLAETYPLQAKIDQLSKQISQYPNVPGFPSQGLERVERLLEKLRDLEVDLEEAAKKREGLEQELVGITIYPKLLDLEERILHLHRQVPLWEEKRNRLQGNAAQIEECRQNLLDAMELLGLDGREDQLAAIELSILRKEQVRKQAQIFSDLRAEYHSLSTIYQTKQEEWEGKQREWQEAKARLAALPAGENLDEWETAFHTYQKLFHEMESERKVANWLKEQWQESSQKPREKQAKPAQAFAAITLMLTAVFSLGTAFYFKTIVIPIFMAFAGVLVSLIYWQQSRQGSGAKGQIGDLKRRWLEKEKQVQAKQEAVFQMAQRFQGETSLEKIAQMVATVRKQRERFRQAEEKVHWLQEVYFSLERDVEKIEQRLAGIQAKEEQELNAWEASLAFWGFPAGTSPEGAMDWFAAAEKAKDILKKKEQLEERKKQLQIDNQIFEEDIQGLLDELSLAMKEENVIHQLLFLKQMLEEHRHRREKAESVKEQLTAAKDHYTRAALQKQKFTEELSHLFALATVGDEEQFRQLAALLNERQKLEEEEVTLQSVLNSTLSHPEWKQKLAEINEEELIATRNMCEQTISHLQQLIQEKLDLRGQMKSRIQELESGERLVNLLQQQQDLRAETYMLAKKWVIYRLTSQLLSQTREIYESEKQPQVLREASHFFQMISKGTYQKIISPLGEKRLLVERNDGMRLEPRFLSRGTKEQLFLSLRFALVRENGLSQALPVILDDILVNFDETRVLAFLPLLQNIAEEHQILFFTCHEYLSAMLKEGLRNIHYINLNQRNLISEGTK
jgi:uncharacterized protein YhaN